MSNINTANEVFTNETIAALIAERDALKSDLKTSQEWVRKFAIAAIDIEQLEMWNKELSVITAEIKAEKQRRKDEVHELELTEVTLKLLSLEWAVQQFDPSGAALERYLDKAQEMATTVTNWKR